MNVLNPRRNEFRCQLRMVPGFRWSNCCSAVWSGDGGGVSNGLWKPGCEFFEHCFADLQGREKLKFYRLSTEDSVHAVISVALQMRPCFFLLGTDQKCGTARSHS